MGMSIDDAITALERDIHNARLSGHKIDQYMVAIEVMQKYQKIQIEHVIEDGNDYFEPKQDPFKNNYKCKCAESEEMVVVNNRLKDLSERVANIEKQIKEDKEEQLKRLKAEVDYAKFRCTL